MDSSPLQPDRASGERVRPAKQPWRTNFSILGLLGQLILISMVTATPWFFGGVQAAVQIWLFVGVVVASSCWLAGQFTGRSGTAVLPVAIIPLSCAVGLGILQLVPLDANVSAVLSPGEARLGDGLLSERPLADVALAESLGIAARAERQPLSLYPASTRHDLALLMLAVAVFLLGANYFKTARAQVWLCGLIAVNGAALAFWGLVQQLTWNGLLYWSVPLTSGGAPFGPFVNRNNAGGFLNLCLAGAVGMMVWATARNGPGVSATGGEQLRASHRSPAKLRQQLLGFCAHLNAPTIVAASLVVLILVGILCSLSRGAWMAMIGATILTTLVGLRTRRGTLRLRWIGIVAMAGLALVGWVGMSNSVQARFATLLDQETISQARIPHWRDGLKAVPDFWQLGSGLGTYRYVYGPYQRRLDEMWYYHAENQYLEALVEGGIAGLGLVLIMIGLVGTAAWRLLRDDPDPRIFAAGIVGVFALSGQAIHAFFDFGLYLPANMMLFALLCGSISGRVAHLANKGWSPGFFALPRARTLSRLLVASLLGANIWGCLEIRGVAAVEAALNNTRFAQTPAGTTPEALRGAIKRLSAALEHREDDAEAQRHLAGLWIHLYRARALEQLRQEAATSAADDSKLWQLTSPVVLHGRAHEFAKHNLLSQLERLRGEPVVRNHLTHALRHLILARRWCALLPKVHLMIAELCVLATDPADDRIHLQRVRQLAPADPDLLFRCGVLEINAGRPDSAYDGWRRSLALSSRHLEDILRFVDRQPLRPQAIEKLLPDSPMLLIQLAKDRYRDAEHVDVRRMLLQRAADLIEKRDLPEDERHYLRGSVLALGELYPQAIEYYSRAVTLRSQQLDWRYELALALRHQGRLSEAHEQAKFCARMEPSRREYRTLLEEINRTQLWISGGRQE